MAPARVCLGAGPEPKRDPMEGKDAISSSEKHTIPKRLPFLTFLASFIDLFPLKNNSEVISRASLSEIEREPYM